MQGASPRRLDWERSYPLVGDAFPGVVRACRGPTRPIFISGAGATWCPSPPILEEVGRQTRLASMVSGREDSSNARVGHPLRRVFVNTRVGEHAAMHVLGTQAVGCGHREMVRAARHKAPASASARGSAEAVERRCKARPGLYGPTQ
jgi:hypothetical protein